MSVAEARRRIWPMNTGTCGRSPSGSILKCRHLLITIANSAGDDGIAQALLFEQLFNRPDFRQEAGNNNQLFTLLHSAVENVLQYRQLRRAYLLHGGGFVIADKSARKLGQAQQPGEYVGGGNLFALE